jgi:hypothetical protein
VLQQNCDQELTRADLGVAAGLGALTSIVVLVQNARLTVLWDLSYILENATRIAMGDVPYRDFPFPYAPLTFVFQALIIKLFGRALWHHVAYAAIAGGLATALTYAIVRCVAARGRAAIFTLPLIPLGIYCIYPHPFYDPDCCLAILAIVFAWQRWPRRFWIGVAAVLPLFIKQNIGLAFLIAIVVLALIAREWRMLAGVATGLVAAIALVAAIFGIGNYIQWTVRFAAARRLPPIGDVLAMYVDPTLVWWLALVLAGVLIARWQRAVGAGIACIPFIWCIARIYLTDDSLEREINLLRTWPLVLVCGAIAALVMRELIPLLLIATVHGAFLSQMAWGSTYAIWPLLVIIAAYAMRRLPLALPVAFTLALLFGGIPYVVKNERLTYAKLDFDWQSGFRELVDWTDRNVPRGDAIVCIPGEDLFYFTTGRRPRFPVLMFDRTINPYNARTIDALIRARGVRWVIVKERLQLNGTPMENRDETLRLVATHARVVARLRNYTVWQTGALPVHESGDFRNGSLDDRPAEKLEARPRRIRYLSRHPLTVIRYPGAAGR